MKILTSFQNLKRREWALWITSIAAVIVSAFWDGVDAPFSLVKFQTPYNLVSTAASLIGATALIFVSKGDVLGQVLTVVFSLFYGGISLTFQYYGEMITYLCMTGPIAGMAVVSWLRHPFAKNKQEVAVNRLPPLERICLLPLTAAVTFAFYWILAAFHTANVEWSTLSIATSFLASYLTFRRSAFYALAYAANDVVLIVLWTLAAQTDSAYFSMVTCFAAFLANDIYGFFNWQRIRDRQSQRK